MHKRGAGRPDLRAVLAASTVSTAGVLPVYLLSSIAVLIRRDLGFTEAQLGLSVSAFFAFGALASIPSGVTAERLGSRGSLVAGAVGSGAALLGMAMAPTWPVLLGWLILGGVANSLSQIAANAKLAGTVSKHRQGLAFGIKQSANPIATLAGGLAVPAIALTLGWRWAFMMGAALALLSGAAQARRQADSPSMRWTKPAKITLVRRPLLLLGIALAFGSAAVTAMAAFVVEYAVFAGVAPGSAGLILAAGSIVAISVRVSMGWSADRRHGISLMLVIVLLASGSIVFAAFPLVSTTASIAIVTVLAYGIGWGWPGLFNLAVVRGNPHAPAAATGVTQVGAYTGGVAGPLSFGLLVSNFGYPVAWWASASWLLVGAILMIAGRIIARRAWLPPPAGPTDATDPKESSG